MSSSTAIHYAHEEIDRYFSEAFTTFSELRKSNVMTDIILTTSNDLAIHNVVEYESDTTKMESFKDKNKTLCNGVPAHKMVLMGASDYFRTMFKSCYEESQCDKVVLPGVQEEDLEPIVNYFYTGSIVINGDNVGSLLSAASLLLLPRMIQACGRFLEAQMDVMNCLTIRMLAETFGSGDLQWLKEETDQYIRLHFEELRNMNSGEEGQEQTNFYASFGHFDLRQILQADDLCVDTEESVYECVQQWIQYNAVSSTSMLISSTSDVTCTDVADTDIIRRDDNVKAKEIRKDSLSNNDIISLWNTVRFPLLTKEFVKTIVMSSDQFIPFISKTESFSVAAALHQYESEGNSCAIPPAGVEDIGTDSSNGNPSVPKMLLAGGHIQEQLQNNSSENVGVLGEKTRSRASMTLLWSRAFRSRGGPNQMIVAHADGSTCLEFLNTNESGGNDIWQHLVDLPLSNCATEYLSLASHRTKIYLAGGKGPLPSDTCTLRMCNIYDMETEEWSRGPNMNEERSYHGLVRISDALYAVGGCGQLNSMESLCLSSRNVENINNDAEGIQEHSSQWIMKEAMNSHRHLPGVGTHNEQIFVVGGTNDNWEAQPMVESYDPALNRWIRFPDLNCPRARPAVVSVCGQLYVIGGRNSKKAELFSVERFDPIMNRWDILQTGLKRKRWSCAAVPFRGDQHIVVIGGRGKWVGNSVEVYDPHSEKFALAPNGPNLPNRAYSAVVVTISHRKLKQHLV